MFKINAYKEIANRLKFSFIIYILIIWGLFFNPAQANLINKYQLWKKLITENVSSIEIFNFFQENPSWPRRENLIEKAEKSLKDIKNDQILEKD